MKVSTRQKITRCREFLKKLPYFLGERSFLVFLIFTCLALVLGGILFYKYSVLIERKEPRVSEATLQFKEECFQKVLKERQKREERFNKTQTKTYPDPFQKN